MDYKKIMEEEKVSFPEVYEKAIQNKQASLFVDEELEKRLHDKREFGLKKYGEHSFQGSFENCMASPTIEHAQEELIDCINYLLHEQYKNDLRCITDDKVLNILKKVLGIYYEIEKL